MKHFSCVFLSLFLITSAVVSQTLTSYIFSPTQGASEPIPYAEIDFLPVGLQGLGFQLHNVVRDSVADMFRNPAALYHLDRGLVLLNYERATTFHYKVSRRLGFLSPSNLRPIPIGSSPSNAYFTAGYWSPDFLSAGIPAGVFFRGASSRYAFAGSSDYPAFNPFSDGYLTRTDEEIKIKDLFGQIWLGLLNRPGFQLALSYNFNYLDATAGGRRDAAQLSGYGRSGFHQYVSTDEYESDLQWYRHRFSLGSRFSAGGWDIEPAVSFLIFSNEEMLSEFSEYQSYDFEAGNPDSIIYGNFNYSDKGSSLKRDLNALEANLQAAKGRTVLFASGLYSSFSPEENVSVEMEDFRISNYDTTQFNQSTANFDFEDDGKLLRLRAGIGRRYSLKSHWSLYGAFITEYERHTLSGILSGAGDKRQFDFSDTTQIDSVFHNPLDYAARQLRFILPIGMELKWKMLALRLGLVWYYWDQNEELDLEDQAGSNVFHAEQSGSQAFREEYFGFGLRWKKLRMNVAATSDILNIRNWNVGLRYYLN